MSTSPSDQNRRLGRATPPYHILQRLLNQQSQLIHWDLPKMSTTRNYTLGNNCSLHKVNSSKDADLLGSQWARWSKPQTTKYERLLRIITSWHSHETPTHHLCFLKMTEGQQVPDLDPELIITQCFDFTEPKLIFKNIGCYSATPTYIHVCILFNFTTVFNT